MDYRRRSFALKLLGEKTDDSYRNNIPLYATERENSQSFFLQEKYSPPPGTKVVETACYGCNSGCEVLVFVDERTGRILTVEGDPRSPFTKGILCSKGLAAKDLVYNPSRVTYPLKRIGTRGGNQWQRISWEEAFTEIVKNLVYYKDKLGPQGVTFLQGTQRGWTRFFSRLANSFGIVNHGAAGWAQCMWPRLVENKVTFGSSYTETADYSQTKCILNWAINPPATWAYKAAEIMDARERGAALIVVDPYLSETAAKADIWLQLKPGTDTALALSMQHVIITEDLYDHNFIDKWTQGFDKLQDHIKKFTPQWGESVTGVKASLIIAAARLYARTKPASITRCVALDMVHDSIQACRAVSLLAALTSNIGIPGGNILVSSRGDISQNSLDFIAHDLIPPEDLPLRRGYDEFPLLCGLLSPVPSAHMPTLWETIATEKPYPVKAAVIFGSNALVSYSNTHRVKEAMDNLDYIVVADMFMTPTAQMADLFLPVCSWLERDNVISSYQASPDLTYVQQKAVEPVGESKSDVDIICDLAQRLGLGQHFWQDSQAAYDYIIKPTGLTFQEFKKQKRIYSPIVFRQYEESGFKTPSGKIELYSSILEGYNLPPLPTYTEPKNDNGGEGGSAVEAYPLILTTGARVPVFRHTENRENPLLREICPSSKILIHPTTARKYEFLEGDEVIIETSTGAAKALACVTEGIRPEVVQVIPGWQGVENINRVIPWGHYSEGIGSVPMRGLQCRIRKNRSHSLENGGDGNG